MGRSGRTRQRGHGGGVPDRSVTRPDAALERDADPLAGPQFRQDGRLLPIARIVETSAWRAQDANVVYPESGSFMRWVIDTYGLDGVRELYRAATGPNEAAAGVRAAFATAFGISTDDAEQAWLAMLVAG
jgi:hypothetical protein